jgi:hypothetical protein
MNMPPLIHPDVETREVARLLEEIEETESAD